MTGSQRGENDVKIGERMESELAFWNLKAGRLRLSILLCLAVGSIAMARNSLSMAMVCMVNSNFKGSASDLRPSNARQSVLPTSAQHCPSAELAGHFNWSKEQQDNLFSAVYWGALISGIPGGILADKYGSTNIIFFCLLGTALSMAIIPTAAYSSGYESVFALRLATGIFGQGAVVPAVGALMSKWIPPTERSSVIAMYTAGNQISNVIGMPLNAFLCQQRQLFGGWPSIFYLCSLLGLIVGFLWLAVVTDSPDKSYWMTEREIAMIDRSLKSHRSSTKLNVPLRQLPWRKLLFSWPLISVNINCFTYQFVSTMLSTYLPIYFKEAMHLNIRQNGIVSALPYIAQLVTKLVFAAMADRMKSNRPAEATKICKIFNSVGTFGAGSFLLALSLVDCQHSAEAIAFMIMANALISGAVPGFMTSTLSVAPNYSGTVSSISKYHGQVAAVIAPYFVGAMLHGDTPEQWHPVFLVIGVALFSSGIIFIIFGSCEVQDWAKVTQDNDRAMSSIDNVAHKSKRTVYS
ncbi:inorganic phosphate cotransporter [Trichuris trichiura]|uniref:Inorganic phosphate cotransporter n=1 Tax=Trichuris trichiura TaxID=36087 RepID=A0A077YXP8_TRITR|nr:inorganic phosphate cotransporter [Trichuris trichiura]